MTDIIDAAQDLEQRLRESALACHRIPVAELALDICVGCGDPIPAKRKKAVPSTLRCAECQSEFEGGKFP